MEHGSTYKNRRSGVQRSWAGEGGGKKVVKVIQERGIKLSGKNLRDVEITRGGGRCWICNLTRIGNLSLSFERENSKVKGATTASCLPCKFRRFGKQRYRGKM